MYICSVSGPFLGSIGLFLRNYSIERQPNVCPPDKVSLTYTFSLSFLLLPQRPPGYSKCPINHQQFIILLIQDE